MEQSYEPGEPDGLPARETDDDLTPYGRKALMPMLGAVLCLASACLTVWLVVAAARVGWW
jgi:hypothetical protein